MALQEHRVREPVAGGVIDRDAVPAEVLDRHPRLVADRVEAQGGTLRVESARGSGTRVVGEIPCGS